MKKLFLGILAAAMLMACNQSGQKNGSAAPGADTTKVSAANAPVMKFETETHDFGKVNAGTKVAYAFKFINTGKSPLIVTDAQASCGCTKPDWPHKPVQPGDSSAIQVTFDSARRNGLQDKLITITANTVPSQNMVHLIGEVITVTK